MKNWIKSTYKFICMKYLAFSNSALALLAPTAYKCSLHRAGVPETHSRDAKPKELGKTFQKNTSSLGHCPETDN